MPGSINVLSNTRTALNAIEASVRAPTPSNAADAADCLPRGPRSRDMVSEGGVHCYLGSHYQGRELSLCDRTALYRSAGRNGCDMPTKQRPTSTDLQISVISAKNSGVLGSWAFFFSLVRHRGQKPLELITSQRLHRGENPAIGTSNRSRSDS